MSPPNKSARGWLLPTFGVWGVLVGLWFFTCYHFADGRVQVDGWWMTCRPGFEDSYGVMFTVTSAFLFLIVMLVTRRILRRSQQT